MGIVSQLLTKAPGRFFRVEDVLEIGRRVLRTELAFNRAAGLNKADNRLPEFFRPEFFRVEKLSPKALVFDVSDKDIDQVHSTLEK